MTSATDNNVKKVKKVEKVKPMKKKGRLANEFKQNWLLYLMILPGLLYFLIFKYAPMGGLVIAFQNYFPFLGIKGSQWVGLEHFRRFFTSGDFAMLMRNTLVLFGLNLVFAFPASIILAIALNEVRNTRFKKGVQTIVYLPHFISWVIVVSIFYVLLTTEGGAINNVIASAGKDKVPFLTDPKWFRPLYIIQEIWKGAGWGSIVYLAALTNVDQQLYEAADLDGASRMQMIWHVTLPSIRPTIITMLILKVGDVLELGFEHVYVMLNSLNRGVAEIFDTFVYTAGITNGQLSFSTAVGFFKSIVGLILVIFANRLAKKVGEEGVY
jgi:putative aldouronate transport system permease protein